jgi:hypothetical protein
MKKRKRHKSGPRLFFRDKLDKFWSKPFEIELRPKVKGMLHLKAIGRTSDIKALEVHVGQLMPIFFTGPLNVKLSYLRELPNFDIDDFHLRSKHKLVYIEITKPEPKNLIKNIDEDFRFGFKFWRHSHSLFRYLYYVGEAGNMRSDVDALNYWDMWFIQYLLYLKSRSSMSIEERVNYVKLEERRLRSKYALRAKRKSETTGLEDYFDRLVNEFHDELLQTTVAKACAQCGELFVPTRQRTKFCKSACNNLFKTKKYKGKNKEKIRIADKKYQKDRRAFYKEKGVLVTDLI